MTKQNNFKKPDSDYVFFSSSFGIWWVRKEEDGYYIYQSPSPRDFYHSDGTEVKRRKVFGKKWQEISDKVIGIDDTYAPYHAVIRTKFNSIVIGESDKTTYVSPWLNKEGEIIWLEDQLNVIERDENGEATFIVGCTFDVTTSLEYKKSLTELEETKEEMDKAKQRAIDLAQLLVWQIDYDLFPEGDFFLANQLYKDTLGLEIHEGGYLKLDDFFTTAYTDDEGKETMGRLIELFTETVANESDQFLGVQVKHRNLITGEVVYLEHNTRVESRYEDGKLRLVGGYIRDVTEQIKMEQENKELLERNIRLERAQRLAIKSGKVLIWYLDSEKEKNNKYFYGNDFLIDTLGLERYGEDKFSVDEFNRSVYDGDEEGKELKEAYFHMDDIVEDNEIDSYDKLLVKHQNLKTGELFYLEHNFEVESRYEDGSLKVRGGFMMDVTKEIMYKKRNEYLVSYDEITGLLNRYSFERYTHSDELPEDYTLIVADIDGLKFINDAFGHIMGDKAISFVAEKLIQYFGDKSKIFRIGGDEYAIISEVTYEKDLESRIKQLRDSLVEFYNENQFQINVSIGYELVDKNIDFQEAFIEAENLMYRRKLNERNSRKSKTMETVLETLNQKTEETKEHCTRMGEYAVSLMRSLGYNRSSDLEDMKLLCQVHDIGKITVSEDILSKKGKLSKEEYTKIRNHSEAGYKIVRNIVESDRIAYGVLYHHERIDGKGYPFGLKGDEIPLFAKIVSICDAYDVMITGRKYSPKRTKTEVIKELKRCAGTQFDKRIVEVFIKMIE